MSAALPSDGTTLVPSELDAVRPFVDAGLITLAPFDVVYCAEVPDDEGDGDPDCDAWEPPGSDDELQCPMCGRVFWFEAQHVRQRFRVRHERAGVEAWLEARLAQEGAVERLTGGCAWRLTVGGEETVFAVLDWSEDARWVRADRMAADPTVLVLLRPPLYRTRLRPGVVAVDLEALVFGQDLTGALAEARQAEITFERPMAWMAVHTLPNRTYCRRLGAHRLDAIGGELRVDGVVVERSGGAYGVVRWLVARHAEDVGAGKSPDAHCWWPAQELADELSGADGVTRDQVKRALARFVAEARSVYRQETGLELGADAVIESCRAGYRVNPAVYGRVA